MLHNALQMYMINDIARFAAPSQPEKLEVNLYPPFASVLQNDVQGQLAA